MPVALQNPFKRTGRRKKKATADTQAAPTVAPAASGLDLAAWVDSLPDDANLQIRRGGAYMGAVPVGSVKGADIEAGVLDSFGAGRFTLQAQVKGTPGASRAIMVGDIAGASVSSPFPRESQKDRQISALTERLETVEKERRPGDMFASLVEHAPTALAALVPLFTRPKAPDMTADLLKAALEAGSPARMADQFRLIRDMMPPPPAPVVAPPVDGGGGNDLMGQGLGMLAKALGMSVPGMETPADPSPAETAANPLDNPLVAGLVQQLAGAAAERNADGMVNAMLRAYDGAISLGLGNHELIQAFPTHPGEVFDGVCQMVPGLDEQTRLHARNLLVDRVNEAMQGEGSEVQEEPAEEVHEESAAYVPEDPEVDTVDVIPAEQTAEQTEEQPAA